MRETGHISLLVVIGLCLTRCSQEERPTSVLLITIDTLRADHLGCYGYDPYSEPVSPAIDRLARDGVRFEYCYAPRGQTGPSLWSIMTSKYPSAHGVRDNGLLPLGSHSSLAEQLRYSGYQTQAFLAHIPGTSAGLPTQGMEWQRVCSGGRDPMFAKGQPAWDAEVTRLSVDWLKQRESSAPFFLWAHYYQVHRPYMPPAPYNRMFQDDYDGPLLVPKNADAKAWLQIDAAIFRRTLEGQPFEVADHDYILSLYDGGIRSVDEEIAKLLEALRETGAMEQTLIVVSSDHGEELGEHAHYYYHGNSVYDATLRVPLIFYSPKLVAGERVIPSLAQNLDLAPTVLELLELPVPRDWEGVSFADQLRGLDAAPPRELVYSEWQDLIYTVRDREWKYIFNPRGVHPRKPPYFGSDFGFPIDCEELYNVAADPREQRNLVEVDREPRRRMLDHVEAFRERPQFIELWETVSDPELAADLRALGYIAADEDRHDVLFDAVNCNR